MFEKNCEKCAGTGKLDKKTYCDNCMGRGKLYTDAGKELLAFLKDHQPWGDDVDRRIRYEIDNLDRDYDD